MIVPSGRHDDSHFRIDDLRSRVTPGDGSLPVGLHVESLSAVATRAGLGALVDQLGPKNVAVAIGFARPAPGTGVDIAVQASRWGFSARMNLQVRLHPDMLGALQVSLSPGRGWHPADLTMLGIIRSRIAGQAAGRPEVLQTGSRSFEIDIQHLVHDALSAGGVPVQWGVALSDIAPVDDEIRFHFTPVPEAARTPPSPGE